MLILSLFHCKKKKKKKKKKNNITLYGEIFIS